MKNFDAFLLPIIVSLTCYNGVYLKSVDVDVPQQVKSVEVPKIEMKGDSEKSIIDNGGLDPKLIKIDPVNTAVTLKLKPVDALEKVVNSALLPGPQIVSNVDDQSKTGEVTSNTDVNQNNNASDTKEIIGQTVESGKNLEVAEGHKNLDETVNDDGHVSLDEKGNGMMTGNEDWSNDGTEGENTKVDSDKTGDIDGESTKEVTTAMAGMLSSSTTAYYDDDDDEADDDDDYDYEDDKSKGTTERWWEEDEDTDEDDYDYEYDDDKDEDVYKEEEDVPTGVTDNWWEESESSTKATWTTEAWYEDTTDSDKDYDDESQDEDYKDDSEESVDAGKNMMESGHHFDNNIGVFGGAKVSSKNGYMKVGDRTVYSWTLLLSICLVLVLFVLFWNRQRVEKYIVSLRSSGSSSQNVHSIRRGDEGKNLLKHEYA